jgi:hypothetical protein
MTMKRLILATFILLTAMPAFSTAARADMALSTAARASMSRQDTQDKKRPNPTPKPGPRDDGEGDQ